MDGSVYRQGNLAKRKIEVCAMEPLSMIAFGPLRDSRSKAQVTKGGRTLTHLSTLRSRL